MGGPATTLLERRAEQHALETALRRAAAGDGGVLVVSGAPGLGKSALLATARTLAARAGFTVAFGRGAELEQHFAFGVVRQLFERSVEVVPEGERDRVFEGPAASARLVLGPPRPADGVDHSALTLAHGLYWLVVALADRRPLALVVDDVHWSDADSVAFLGYLARRLDELPVLLVLATRPDERGPHETLLDELAGRPTTTMLRPRPLTERAVVQLVRESLGTGASEALCHACHERTRGNPLYLRQLLLALAAEGIDPAVPPEAASAQVERHGAAAIRELIHARLVRYGADALALARALAILGETVDVGRVIALSRLPDPVAREVADQLVRAGFLETDPHLAFVHPLVRAAVYEDLAPLERRAWHARAAHALLAAGAPGELVASQVLAAPGHSDETWLPVLLQAAAEARRRGSPETAAAYLERALAEPAAEAHRVELLRALGLARSYTGDLAAGEPDLRRALELASDPAQRARCALSFGRLLSVTGRTVEAVEAFERGLGDAEGLDPGLALTVEAELIGIARLTSSRASTWITGVPRFAELATQSGHRAIATAYRALHGLYLGESRTESATLADEALTAGRLSPNRPAYYIATQALTVCERFDVADRHLTAALAAARRSGNRVTDPVVLAHRAMTAWAAGDPSRARMDVLAGLEVCPPPNFSRLLLHATQVNCLIDEDRPGDAEEALAAAGLDGHVPDVAYGVDLLAARGRLQLALDRPERALEDLLDSGRRHRSFGPRGVLVDGWALLAAEAQARLGDRDRARALAAEVLREARAFGAPATLGAALRVAGAVEGSPAELELLGDAVAVLDDAGHPPELARALLELGSALRRHRRAGEGRDLLRRAATVALDAGVPALATHAQRELAARGGRPARLELTGVHALTPQERRIAELAGEGLTNRQIAQELFITEKTVETHLGSVYRKLDIRSRWQLQDALPRRSTPAPAAGAAG